MQCNVSFKRRRRAPSYHEPGIRRQCHSVSLSDSTNEAGRGYQSTTREMSRRGCGVVSSARSLCVFSAEIKPF